MAKTVYDKDDDITLVIDDEFDSQNDENVFDIKEPLGVAKMDEFEDDE